MSPLLHPREGAERSLGGFSIFLIKRKGLTAAVEYTSTHTQITKTLPLFTLEGKLFSWYGIWTPGLSNIFDLLFWIKVSLSLIYSQSEMNFYLRGKGPKASNFWIIYMACSCCRKKKTTEVTLLKHTFHNCILNNASHKVEIWVCPLNIKMLCNVLVEKAKVVG